MSGLASALTPQAMGPITLQWTNLTRRAIAFSILPMDTSCLTKVTSGICRPVYGTFYNERSPIFSLDPPLRWTDFHGTEPSFPVLSAVPVLPAVNDLPSKAPPPRPLALFTDLTFLLDPVQAGGGDEWRKEEVNGGAGERGSAALSSRGPPRLPRGSKHQRGRVGIGTERR